LIGKEFCSRKWFEPGWNMFHPWRMVSKRAMRIAAWSEAFLIFLTGAGIVALIVLWARLDGLLAPSESPVLVRARIVSGLFSLLVPLVILIFLTSVRGRLAALLGGQDADASAMKSAKYMWCLVMIFSAVILAITGNVVLGSFQDINFK
jgi:hypothetical protein